MIWSGIQVPQLGITIRKGDADDLKRTMVRDDVAKQVRTFSAQVYSALLA